MKKNAIILPLVGQEFSAQVTTNRGSQLEKTHVDQFKFLGLNPERPGDSGFREYLILNLKTGHQSEVDADWFNTELTGRQIIF